MQLTQGMPVVQISMRLNPAAAAYVVQGMMANAGVPGAGAFAAQIEATINLLYRSGGLLAVQSGSVLEQHLVRTAQAAQAAQARPIAPPVATPPPAPVMIPVPAPAPLPPPNPIAPATPLTAAPIENGEIMVAGTQVVDATPLG
jgi:hypothetical protein